MFGVVRIKDKAQLVSSSVALLAELVYFFLWAEKNLFEKGFTNNFWWTKNWEGVGGRFMLIILRSHLIILLII